MVIQAHSIVMGSRFKDVDGDYDMDAWFPMTNGKLYYYEKHLLIVYHQTLLLMVVLMAALLVGVFGLRRWNYCN